MGEIRILIADSDINNRNGIKTVMMTGEYTLDEASDGIGALKLFRRNEYQVVLLEAALPELDGFTVCRQMRKVSDIPILILSSNPSEELKLDFFDAGVDDFVLKPIDPREILARVKVMLRRSGLQGELGNRRIICDGLCIDLISRMVYVDGSNISLTPREYSLLLFLAQNPYKAFSRDTLLTKVWGEDYLGTDRTVDTHIKTLRESIKPYNDFIVTIWGYGYMFKEE